MYQRLIGVFLVFAFALNANTATNPALLQPGWWSDFKKSLSPETIEQQRAYFSSLIDEIPFENQAAAKQNADQFIEIVTQLQTPPEAAPAEETKPLVLKESYSLDEYLDLARALRSAAAGSDAQQDKLQEIDTRLETAKSTLDRNLARFSNEENTASVERILEGLQQMRSRAQYEAGQVYRKLVADKSKDLTTIATALREHMQQVRPRVKGQKGSLAKIEKRVEQLARSLPKERPLHTNHGEAVQLDDAKNRLIESEVTTLQIRSALIQNQLTPEMVNNWSEKIRQADFWSHQWRDDSTRALIRYSKQPGDVPIEERDRLISLLNLAGELDEQVFIGEKLLQIVEIQMTSQGTPFERFKATVLLKTQAINRLVSDWIDYPLTTVGEEEAPVTPWSLIKVALIFLGASFLSGWVRRRLAALAAKRGGASTSNFYVFGRLIHFGFLSVAFLMALSVIGIRLSTLLIVGGALGVGIGFGLQGIVNNFVCGLIILFEKNVRVGDLLKLADGTVGKVSEINVQSAVIRTFDGIDIIIPNSQLLGSAVTNWTLRDSFLRLHIPFGVAYGTDPELVHQVIKEAALALDFTQTTAPHEPQVWLTSLGNNAHEYELIAWININKTPRTGSVKATYLAAIEKALREAKITVPFPQQDLYIKEWPDTAKP